jgi:hypothetical protein
MIRKVLSVIAALLIIYGFSIIHRDSYIMERTGGILIGAGCLYFIILLVLTQKKDDNEANS